MPGKDVQSKRPAALPVSYAAVLADIKSRIQKERIKAVLSANAAMVLMYWDIGRLVLQNQKDEGWGAHVVDRLSKDLQGSFPDLRSFSKRNLLFMRAFAESYPDGEIVKQLVSRIPWGHIIRLLQTVKEAPIRAWYIRQAVKNGWSRSILEMQIESRAHARHAGSQNNFANALPPSDSDMAAQVFKDPYLFDFLGTTDSRREAEVERGLIEHVQKFLLELGDGFAFVGRQVKLELDGSDYYIDLLFYHLRLRRYVVIELKAVSFKPEFVGKMNMYLSVVDDRLRHPDDKPSIGLLLVKDRKRMLVEYALRGFGKPLGVARWQTEITRSLPAELKSSLPTVEEIEKELAGDD